MAEPPAARPDLPAGTVTLLFTDVEGSTRLLRRLGARYGEVQARLRALLRDCFARFGGVEVDTQGDAFMVAFPRAGQAAAAAIEAQRALAAEPWPERVGVPVRMGLHTGEPERGPEGYVGLDVVRAARICAAAHGGQILVSEVTRDLLAEAGLELRDLGVHQLKDLPGPERLYQLLAGGLPSTFPRPRTQGGATLPALHHRLIGRDRELAQLGELLAQPDVRLVTITGPGGAGKSRLALEATDVAARERPVQLVGLAPVGDAALVLGEVARAVGAREREGRPIAESVADILRGTRTLLFLDNLEHLTGAARGLALLLDLVPDLDLLVTSRLPLRLSGEHVLQLEPLALDDATTLLAELAAARGVVLRGDALPAVREICRRLDGLPLAIELVAARLVLLPPARVLQALDEGIALDMEGPVDLPERQRTLQATIAWSLGLLDERQRALHDALAVFPGGCTLEDARAVSEAGLSFYRDLEALVACSLVRSDVTDGDVRLSMLETVREEAVRRLAENGRLEDLRGRHAERFLRLALAAEEELAGPTHAACLARVERELDNLRAALDWLLGAGRAGDALRLTVALERFWRGRAHVSEARRWLARGLDSGRDLAPPVRAAALHSAAHQAMAQSDWPAASRLFAEAERLFAAGGLRADESVTLSLHSFVQLRLDAADAAEELAARALELARESGDGRASAFALMAVGDVAWVRGDVARALELYEEAVALRRGLGDPLNVADAIYNLGMAAFQGGKRARARAAFQEALALASELDEDPYVAAARFMLGQLDALEGRPAEAAAHARESLRRYRALEDWRSCARCLTILAAAAAAQGAAEEAARLLGAAEGLRGGEPPDAFETPLLERYAAGLEAALGGDRLAALKREAIPLARTAAAGVVSPVGAE